MRRTRSVIPYRNYSVAFWILIHVWNADPDSGSIKTVKLVHLNLKIWYTAIFQLARYGINLRYFSFEANRFFLRFSSCSKKS